MSQDSKSNSRPSRSASKPSPQGKRKGAGGKQSRQAKDSPALQFVGQLTVKLKNLWHAFAGLMRTERTRSKVALIAGIALLFAGVLGVCALCSFFSAGMHDEVFVSDPASMSESEGFHNTFGPVGARVASAVFQGAIGIASFLFFGYLAYVGFLFIVKVPDRSRRFIKASFRLVFWSVWLSLTLGYFSQRQADGVYFKWGGEWGQMVADWLEGQIGFGILAVILFYLVVGLVIDFKGFSRWVSKPRELKQPDISKGWLGKLASLLKRKEAEPNPYEDEAEEEDGDESQMDATTYESEPEDDGIVDYVEDEPYTPEATDAPYTYNIYDGNEEDTGEDEPSIGGEAYPHQAVSHTIASAPQPQVEGGGLLIEKAPEDDLVDVSDGEAEPLQSLPIVYQLPSVSLLKEHEQNAKEQDPVEIERNKDKIISTLASFKIGVRPEKATVGPTVTLYEFVLDEGVKVSKIKSMEDDIAMALKSEGTRIIAPMPGKGTIGIEVPNPTAQVVSMRSIIASRRYNDERERMELPVGIGKTIMNQPFIFDLTKTPHLLIAGATGQGKSVGLNAMITSLLYSKRPDELKLVMVDPKMLEFSIYEELEELFLAKLPDADKAIITDMAKVVPTLNSLCIEMDNRYQMLSDARVRNIKEYNQRVREDEEFRAMGHSIIPYIVLIIDEFADLIMTSGKEVELPIARLAQKARAAGIHMVIATQRPSTNVITGLIKANFPSRIAFKVFSMVDSRTILDSPGANQLIGRGDMLMYQGKDMERIQCAYLDTPETESIVEHISLQRAGAEPYLLPEPPMEDDGADKSFAPSERDPLFKEVARHVVETGIGSTSNIQRKFNIGYNRAGRLMDQLEFAQIVGPQKGSKPREIRVRDLASLEELLYDMD